jgi:hypothetical protein
MKKIGIKASIGHQKFTSRDILYYSFGNKGYLKGAVMTANVDQVSVPLFVPGQKAYDGGVIAYVKESGFYPNGPDLPHGYMEAIDWVQEIKKTGSSGFYKGSTVTACRDLNDEMQLYKGHSMIYPLHIMIEGLVQSAGIFIPYLGHQGSITLDETSGKMMSGAVHAETATRLIYTATITRCRKKMGLVILEGNGEVFVQERHVDKDRLVAKSKYFKIICQISDGEHMLI